MLMFKNFEQTFKTKTIYFTRHDELLDKTYLTVQILSYSSLILTTFLHV